ncbi:MAG: hypothetical protein AMXMBFR84_12270 [Candidatus Hydrogenedentota bacterium]
MHGALRTRWVNVVIALIVHGGAGAWPDDMKVRAETGCLDAVAAGRIHLENGGSALDAVEAAVRELESNPIFNAGIGAHPTRDGVAEMDAIVADGHKQNFGAVAALTGQIHPVSIARQVLDKSPHCFLVGQGANTFAEEQGFRAVANEDLVAVPSQTGFPPPGDTVGAVALDGQGRMAAATSTGGIRGKWPGRVGDSPLFGSGAYADGVCGISATGQGESIMRALLAARVGDHIRSGTAPAEAASLGIEMLAQYANGKGGIICLSVTGAVGIARNTAHMPYACFIEHQPPFAGF